MSTASTTPIDPAPNRPDSRLYRSTHDRKIAGVCGGIAEAMDWDVNAVRLVAALSILLPGPQVLAYLIAWIVLPTDLEVRAGSLGHATADGVSPAA